MTNLVKRAWAEMEKLKGSRVKFLMDQSPFDEDDENATATNFSFIGRILPTAFPWNETALKIEIKLPEKYPVDPPNVRILTPIHHPNVLTDGESIDTFTQR